MARNPLGLLIASLRKSKKDDSLETNDPAALELRQKLEERIEQALAHVTDAMPVHEDHGEHSDQIEAA